MASSPALITNLVDGLRGRGALRANPADLLAAVAGLGPADQAAVVAAGAVPPLVQMLRSGDVAVQCAAYRALRNVFAGNAARTEAVAAAGSIPLLLHIVRDSGSVDSQVAAADCLAFLSSLSSTASAFLAAGAVPAFVQCMRSPGPPLQGAALTHCTSSQRSRAALRPSRPQAA